MFSNRIIGYAIDSRMKSRLAVAAIDDAVARRGGSGMIAGCVVHSDYAEVFVNPRNPRLAWSEYLWFHFPRVNLDIEL
ncbi:hypothetical protein EB834_15190 [Brevibacterium aurantiacum]|uniref:Uncharacterized protein n=1 Tax=Brevibacterium aurantiacum TaxID=273384 RepID=A0A4Z0KJW0_BREAU|nr:hypothetical protein EB834_15190 [Brevibacterium aurantiacum]